VGEHWQGATHPLLPCQVSHLLMQCWLGSVLHALRPSALAAAVGCADAHPQVSPRQCAAEELGSHELQSLRDLLLPVPHAQVTHAPGVQEVELT
jgi:hypothetical protein